MRNVDAGLDVGFALVNTGTTSATINGTLKSSGGTTLATKASRSAQEFIRRRSRKTSGKVIHVNPVAQFADYSLLLALHKNSFVSPLRGVCCGPKSHG